MKTVKVVAEVILLATEVLVSVVSKIRKAKIFRKREQKFPEEQNNIDNNNI